MLFKIYSYRNKGKNKKLNNKIFYEKMADYGKIILKAVFVNAYSEN